MELYAYIVFFVIVGILLFLMNEPKHQKGF